jgi:hypothetical protein
MSDRVDTEIAKANAKDKESAFNSAVELIEVSEATLRIMTCIDLSKPAKALLSAKSALLASAPSVPAALRFAKDLEVLKREIVLGSSYRTYKTLEEDIEDLVVVMRGILKKLLASHSLKTELVAMCLRVETQVEDLLVITDYPSLSHTHGLLHLLREQLRLLQLVLHPLIQSLSSTQQTSNSWFSRFLGLLTQIEEKTVAAVLAVGLEQPREDGESSQEAEKQVTRKGNRVISLLETIVKQAETLNSTGNEEAKREVERLQMDLEASENQLKLLKERTNKTESDLTALQEAYARSQSELKATKQRLKAQAAKLSLRSIAKTLKSDIMHTWKDAASVPIITEGSAVKRQTLIPIILEEGASDSAGAIAAHSAKPEEKAASKSETIGNTGTVSTNGTAVAKPGPAVAKPGPAVAKPGTAVAKPGTVPPSPKSGAVVSVPKSGVTSPAPTPGATTKVGAAKAGASPVPPPSLPSPKNALGKPKHSSPLGNPVGNPSAPKKAGKK